MYTITNEPHAWDSSTWINIWERGKGLDAFSLCRDGFRKGKKVVSRVQERAGFFPYGSWGDYSRQSDDSLDGLELTGYVDRDDVLGLDCHDTCIP